MQFVSNGVLVWDNCEILATAVERTYPIEGDVTLEQTSVMGPGFTNRGAIVIVTILRCVPDIEGNAPPTPEETEASAEVILTDAQAMWNALLAAVKAGDLGGCRSLAFDGWTAFTVQGGMGGGELRVRMQV